MNNFVSYNPVKVIFGRSALENLGTEARLYGDKALLVYGDRSIKENSIYSKVIDQLEKAGIDHIDYSGVRANPLLSDVHQGIELFREHRCSVVVGVGGGSVIDTAKSVSAGVPAAFDIWKLFIGKKTIGETIPVIAVPTIAGAGSETNNGIVLTHDKKRLKLGFGHRKLFPSVCLADPVSTFTVPANLTSFGAIDTFTHCLEAYLSTNQFSSSVQLGFIETICKTVLSASVSATQQPDSYDDRAALLWAASLALNGITTSGLGKIQFPIHLLAHALSAQHPIAHGAALAAVLPGWLTLNRHRLEARLARFSEAVFNLHGGSVKYKAQRAIELIEAWLVVNDCPTRISDLGRYHFNMLEMKNHCLMQGKIWRLFDYDEQTIDALINRCQ